ncbi:MAG: SigB/SigF/SigG family RNA polymerase sigma factor [Oscillospiraceae bacterium]|jgi:RNA polymerase sporulation-specific sigma factor|nr:SigB/SigF/SigG family RNA polymerase sigma factor [Oscillospiraceae bacterium]
MRYSKVGICGINTRDLKVLSEKEKLKLFKVIRCGTEKEKKQAKDHLLMGNLRLALSVTQKFLNRGENAEDLFQIACIGLIKAISNFNIDFNVKFSTYAVPMMIGEVRRYLRDNSSIRVSRSMRELAYKAIHERDKITAKNKREPTVGEIAKELDVSAENLVVALDSIATPISIYEPVINNGEQESLCFIDQIGDNSDDVNWIKEISMRESIKNLSERQKNILALRFFKGKTQIEVANEIGVSQAQISRLEKSTLKKIKKDL